MRIKILTLLVNTLDAQEREHPTNADTRAGMERAFLALGTILRRLTYINHRPELLQQIADERTLHRQTISDLEDSQGRLLRQIDNQQRQITKQENKIFFQQQEIKRLEEQVKNQKVALAAFNQYK